MRSYSVVIASLAIDAPVKWTDNALSHHHLPEVVAVRRGVSRRIPHPALIRLAVIRELHMRLNVGVATAFQMAARLLDVSGSAAYESGQIRVTFDRAALERVLDARLSAALESAPTPRRGRSKHRP